MVLKVSYFLLFLIAAGSGFLTYRYFVAVTGENIMNSSMIFLNTVILMITWFIGTTIKSDFVQKNFLLMFIAPVSVLYATNFFVMHLDGFFSFEFVYFMLFSACLIISSHLMSLIHLKVENR